MKYLPPHPSVREEVIINWTRNWSHSAKKLEAENQHK